MEKLQKVWKPTRRQEKFLSLPDDVFEGFYGGAASGGKSEALLMLPLARNFVANPHFKGLILRRTIPELEKEIIERAHEYYPGAGGRYNDNKKRYRFASGAIMQFGHAEYENDIRKYDTAEYNYIGFDELTSFTEFQYKYLAFSRCRTADASLPAIVRSASNPGNVGHGWVRKRFVEPCVPGEKLIKERMTLDGVSRDIYRIFIPAKVTDNPHIMKNDPMYLFRMSALPESERRAKQLGDWYTFEGQVFDDWRENPLPDEPANACHIYKPLEVFPVGSPPTYWPRILSIDWGYSAMLCALFGALAPNKRLYIYKEYTSKREKISTWATNLAKLCEDETIDDIILCKSAWQNRGDEKNIAEQFYEHFGREARQPDNDRLGGKTLMQEYLRWRQKPAFAPQGGFDAELAQRIFRLRGMQAYEEYCSAFRPVEPESNLPRLQVSENCPEFRRCIPLCVYDENHKEDVKEFDGDDPYDCGRYLIKAAEAFWQKASKEHEKRQELATILAKHEAQPDYNVLNMRMMQLESRRKSSHSVRRFHYA